MDFSEMGEQAGTGAFEPVLDWLGGFFEYVSDAGMPGTLVTALVAFIGAFAVVWALWYGFKALRKAFSKANF